VAVSGKHKVAWGWKHKMTNPKRKHKVAFKAIGCF